MCLISGKIGLIAPIFDSLQLVSEHISICFDSAIAGSTIFDVFHQPEAQRSPTTGSEVQKHR